MYVADEKATAIGYRLIHENLPKFIDNIKIFERIRDDAPDLLIKLNNVLHEMKDVIKGKMLEKVFSLDYFNETLTQEGIELYNTVIGGKTVAEEKTKIKGLNEYINTDYNQKQTDKKKRKPKFKQLYKQILSDRQSLSFLSEAFENDNEVLETVEKFYSNDLLNFSIEGKAINVLGTIKNVVTGIETFDLSKIYFRSGTSLTDVSKKVFGDWILIQRALENYYEKAYPMKAREKIEKYEERKNKWLKQDFNISALQTAIDDYDNETVKEKNNGKVIEDYLAGFRDEKDMDLIQKVNQAYNAVKDLLNVPYPENEKLGSNKEQVKQIKAFLDSIMDIIHLIKPLSLKDMDKEKDEIFYSLFTPIYDHLNNTISLYNKVRNYLTKKPYSTEKIKLNFENSTLLGGWDLNKETDNTAIILLKDNQYYLGIMDKKHNRIFQRIPVMDNESNCYEKMVYKLLPGANKMLPKVFFSQSRINEFLPSSELLENYANETHKKGDNFNLTHCHKLIDFFKTSISKHEDWKQFNFVFSPTSSYEDLSGFYREVEHQGYKISFKKIAESYIDDLINEGKLYLFQIYNKDFSPYSKGKPNLHTLYWKKLFENNNLKDVVYKLNGQAEVFYRKRSIDEKNNVIHKANENLPNKNPDNPKVTSKFDYDIVKDKRYTLDKFQFHVPITMNFKAEGVLNINQRVNAFLKDNPDVNIIGIDRGERHLLYYTMINQKGRILEQDTLNVIANEKQKVDYHNLLDKREGARETSRQEWGVIETIKELKEGYLSQVIHKLTDLMIANNAIIVVEDLNSGFMRGRQKVEKQVYRKFEKMLIDKLNYLVDKNKKANELGGLLNAFQLANKFESFQKMRKQNGFILYVPAWNTSKIDPATGFVDFLKPRYENLEQAKGFFEKFDSIHFNNEKNYFEFAFDYNNFTEKADKGRTKWTVCTVNEDRFFWSRALNNNRGGQEKCDVTSCLKLLFDGKIYYKNGEDLKLQITGQESADFFKSLMKYLSITLSLRHNNGEKGDKEQDYILSPVTDSRGRFFDSRKAGDEMPRNADANGAYHIALKGLWCLEQISKTKDLKKLELAMSNKEWVQFKQAKI